MGDAVIAATTISYLLPATYRAPDKPPPTLLDAKNLGRNEYQQDHRQKNVIYDSPARFATLACFYGSDVGWIIPRHKIRSFSCWLAFRWLLNFLVQLLIVPGTIVLLYDKDF